MGSLRAISRDTRGPVEGTSERKRQDDGMAVTTWERKSVVVYFHPISDSTQLTWGTGTERRGRR